MTVIAIAIVVFAVATALLSLGVILRKKTPLKGSCQAPAEARKRDPNGDDGEPCPNCACSKAPDPRG